ncbi:hypothetical protein D3C76_1798050 [compost metagenome]
MLRIATARRNCLARLADAKRIAAAPSVTSEQSVKRSGWAMQGLLSDTVLQCSKLIALCICAKGLAMALA